MATKEELLGNGPDKTQTLYQKYCRLTFAALGLWVGGIGQFGLLHRLLKPDWIILALIMVPGVIVYFLSFFKTPPPIGRRSFGRCLLFAVVWSGVGIVLGELGYVTGWIPRPETRTVIFSQLCICVGSLSFIPILRFYSIVRKAGDQQ